MQVSPEDHLKFLLSRRSIRRFRREPIALEEVLRILDVARFAPSAGNRQPWRFIVVTDPEVKGRLSELHPWAWPLREAPLCVAVACDKELAPHSYQVDCASATMYLMLAAHAVGLGTVWIQALRNVEDIQKILRLPPNLVPVALVAMGYPAESPEPKARRELRELVYLNYYGEPLLKS